MHWAWFARLCRQAERKPKVLNLFGYTGIASFVAALAGAEVTHVDASKKAIGWARENQAMSGIADLPASSVATAAPRPRRIAVAAIGAAVAAALVIAAGTWWLWPATKSSQTPAVAATASIAKPLVAPRLSIVVLPVARSPIINSRWPLPIGIIASIGRIPV